MKITNKNMEKRGHELSLSSCYFCNSKSIKETKEVIASDNGLCTEINAFECQKCGETFYSMDNTEKARKFLHPTIMQRIKNHFNKPMPKVSIFKGRVL